MTSKEGNKDLWIAQSVLLEAEPTLMLYYLITVEPSTATKVKTSGLSFQNATESAGKPMVTFWPFCKEELKMFMVKRKMLEWPLILFRRYTLGLSEIQQFSFLRISGLHTRQGQAPLSRLNQLEKSEQPPNSVRWRGLKVKGNCFRSLWRHPSLWLHVASPICRSKAETWSCQCITACD